MSKYPGFMGERFDRGRFSPLRQPIPKARDRSPDVNELIGVVLKSVVIESAARVAATTMLRAYGVGASLHLLNRRPRPFTRLEALVLEKLEAVAVIVGRP